MHVALESERLLKISVVLGVSPGGSVVADPSANAGDIGVIPDSGRPHMLQSN